LEKLRRLINAAQQQKLNHRPECSHHQRRGENAAPKAEPADELGSKRRRQIQPEHIERAVRDIDDAGDAENERQAGAHEKQARGRSEPIERLEQDGFKTHRRRKPLGWRSIPLGQFWWQ